MTEKNVRYYPLSPLTPEVDAKTGAALENIDRKVGGCKDLKETLTLVWEESAAFVPRDRIGLAFIDSDGQRVVAQHAVAAYDTACLEAGYHAGLAGSTLKDIIDSGDCRIIHDLDLYLENHPDSASTRLLVKEGIGSSITLPLKAEGRQIGFLFFSSRGKNVFTEAHARLLLAVSERISQAVEKAWLLQQLADANRRYVEMVGFVAHEMKSPLASMISRGEIYADGFLGETEPKGLDTINRMMAIAHYLVNMVNNYLDFSRLENGEMKFSPKPGVDFGKDVLQFALETVQVRAQQRGSTIAVEQPAENIILTADADLLRIVMINLIDNAVKYGDDQIEVKVTVTLADGKLMVKVRNKGVGFDDEQAKKLFQRFSRLKQKGTENRRGSGLGLYLTWWIVQKHEGKITAASQPGEWAEFSVVLPVK
jgi:signal transduction histidine kinase